MIGHQGQPVGPARVWMQGQDAPGLAMSRSLGDEIAHSIGVNCSPEVSRFTLGPDDKFLVVASDGVWEYLSNEEVGRIVWPFFLRNSPEQAGKALVKAAADKWREQGSVIDDITCIAIFLEVDSQVPSVTGSTRSAYSAFSSAPGVGLLNLSTANPLFPEKFVDKQFLSAK